MLNTSCIGTIRSKVKFKCTVLICKSQNKYQPDMKKTLKNCQFCFLCLEKRKNLVSEQPKTQLLLIE